MSPDEEFVPPAAPPHQPLAASRAANYPASRKGPSLGSLLMLLFLLLPGLIVVLLIGSAFYSFSHSSESHVDEHYHSLSRTATDKIAIISVEGAIIDGDGFVKKQIDQVRADDHVRAVILRVNSPGGTVTASDYLYHHLRKLAEERKLPIVVSMGGVAASGGYYIAMAVGNGEDVIFAEPTTWTGSIGVIIPHYNIAGLMKRWDVEEDSIKSGPLKQMGTPTRPMTDEERQVFQHLVDDSFHRFQSIVKAGRPKLSADEAALAKVSTGQVFTTGEAIASGLVDKEGFIEEAVDRAVELSKLKADAVKVVKYKSRGGLFSLPFTAESRAAPDLAAMLELTSPKAWYLCTWLPSALAQP